MAYHVRLVRNSFLILTVMSKLVISSSGAPAAIGPYSQAIKTGSMVFTSGQIGLDPASGELSPASNNKCVAHLPTSPQ